MSKLATIFTSLAVLGLALNPTKGKIVQIPKLRKDFKKFADNIFEVMEKLEHELVANHGAKRPSESDFRDYLFTLYHYNFQVDGPQRAALIKYIIDRYYSGIKFTLLDIGENALEFRIKIPDGEEILHFPKSRKQIVPHRFIYKMIRLPLKYQDVDFWEYFYNWSK